MVKAAVLTSWRTTVKEEVSLVILWLHIIVGTRWYIWMCGQLLFLLAAGLLLDIIHIVALMNGSNAERDNQNNAWLSSNAKRDQLNYANQFYFI